MTCQQSTSHGFTLNEYLDACADSQILLSVAQIMEHIKNKTPTPSMVRVANELKAKKAQGLPSFDAVAYKLNAEEKKRMLHADRIAQVLTVLGDRAMTMKELLEGLESLGMGMSYNVLRHVVSGSAFAKSRIGGKGGSGCRFSRCADYKVVA